MDMAGHRWMIECGADGGCSTLMLAVEVKLR
jgi:hypothetical protein